MAQTSLNISLPEELKQFVEAKVAEGGYSTPSEFVRELLREAKRRDLDDEVDRELVSALRKGRVVPESVLAKRAGARALGRKNGRRN